MVADFVKKQKGRDSQILLKALAIIFVALAVYLIVANIRLYQKKKELVSEIHNYTEQIKKIEDSNKNLQAEIANTGNTDYIEKVAREEGGMQKPGEKVVSFVMPKAQTAKPQPVKSTFLASLNDFWQKIVDFFR